MKAEKDHHIQYKEGSMLNNKKNPEFIFVVVLKSLGSIKLISWKIQWKQIERCKFQEACNHDGSEM